jgi:hypothetical protein
MRNRLFPILLLLLVINGLYSCKTYKPLAVSPEPSQTINDYINLYKDLAISEMRRTGIPASITLAQAIIESDCGHSYIAREANNHFGIKCHNGWTGPSIKHTDNSRDECFRKYQRAEESFYDHSDFLKSTSRYSFLFGLNSSDYKAWAHGLKKAGYATNPDYANMLIRTIDQNSLWSYDKGYNYPNTVIHAKTPDKLPPYNDTVRINPHAGDSTKKVIQTATYNKPVMARVPRIAVNNRIEFIVVKDGESKEKIENEFQLLKWELSKYNDLKNDFIPVPGQILYLQPKRDKADAGNDFYTTVTGDTMYKIAQQFGIKLKSLYEMNRMEEGAEPEAGSKIWLRKIKPVQ